MRYVILGAGAVGGSIGVLLHRSGYQVQLIARGEHGAAIMDRGLTLRTPDGDVTARIPCVHHPADVDYRPGDVVILAVKSQDTAGAAADLAEAAGDHVAVVCAQNGVDNENIVAAHVSDTYGMMVWMPGVHLEPGVVALYAANPGAVLRIGPHPSGSHARAERMAHELTAAGFDAQAVVDVMRWKYGKLVLNLANAMDALCQRDEHTMATYHAIVAEGARCLRAAGIAFVPPATLTEDMQSRIRNRPIAGEQRPGGSTWQSMQRGTASETTALLGPIVALGRRMRVATPLCEALLALAADAADTGARPRSIATEELLRRAHMTPASVEAAKNTGNTDQ